jgi:hypothetical protein
MFCVDANLTSITVVLDRSGSMGSVAGDVIGGFNAFVDAQRKQPGDATLTLVQFDHEIGTTLQNVPIRDVAPLTRETYCPRGSTALFDALGTTIAGLGATLAATPEHARPGKVIVVVMTDGHENASREYTRERIREMVEHQRERYAWEFVFIGANVDAFAEGTSLGIAGAMTCAYTSDSAGTRGAFETVARTVSTYRGGGTVDMAVR